MKKNAFKYLFVLMMLALSACGPAIDLEAIVLRPNNAQESGDLDLGLSVFFAHFL